MRKIYGSKKFGFNIGTPPLGCQICFNGASIVIFITGKCSDTCYYCPIGFDRRNKEVIFVDDEPVSSLFDIVKEAYAISAKGAAITGGDPLLSLDKTIAVIDLLKNEFGSNFRIHLYTSGRYANKSILRTLNRIGLDEIRFHPVNEHYLKRIEIAVKETSMSIGIEVPAIPGKLEWLKKLAVFLERVGGDFMNINELEVSESNIDALSERGFIVNDDGITVRGSYETAMEFIEWARENIEKISIRFCPASYKDFYQMRNRFIRKALIIGKAYEKHTFSGTLQVIEAKVNGTKDNEHCFKYYEAYKLIEDTIYLHPDENWRKILNEQCIKEPVLIEYYPRLKTRFIIQKTFLGERNI